MSARTRRKSKPASFAQALSSSIVSNTFSAVQEVKSDTNSVLNDLI
jgi:hypothetical protein